MAEEVSPADLRMRPADFVKAFAFAMVIVVVTAVTVASFVEHPEPSPVARVSTEDLAAMADIARAILDDPDTTPARRRVARQLIDVVDAVENGEVQIVPATTNPPPASTSLVVPTTTSTTTTTTTTVPAEPASWPGEFDAPLITTPTLPAPP